MSDETKGIDPYETVLADLYAKRDQIDQAIAAIEALRISFRMVREISSGPIRL